jgi:hypothetical protein
MKQTGSPSKRKAKPKVSWINLLLALAWVIGLVGLSLGIALIER